MRNRQRSAEWNNIHANYSKTLKAIEQSAVIWAIETIWGGKTTEHCARFEVIKIVRRGQPTEPRENPLLTELIARFWAIEKNY